MKHKEVSTSFLFCVFITFWFVFTNSTFLRAEIVLIGVDASSPSRLIRIDKNTGQGTKIESLPVRHVTDIAFSTDGVLYGVTFDMFFKYDRETRRFDKIFSTFSDSCLNSLDFGPNNSLYIADCLFGELLKFDIATTKLSVVGLFEDGYLCSGGLAFSPSGALYATGKRDQFDPEELLEIDVQTGRARSIGFIGFQDVYGLAFDEDGSLYGAANGGRNEVPILIKIDTTSGKGHRVGEVTNANGMWGLATLVSGKPSGDDYPNKWKPNDCWRANDGGCYCPDRPKDDYGFYVKNCTSFVAWRMNRDRGEGSFTNYMSYNGKKGHWGNASNWNNNAEYLGIPVDNFPSVGAIAYWDSGHVAYVESVNGDGTVNISEYNYNNPCAYGERERERANWYIHFNDIIIPDIKANSSDGLVTINTNDTLSVTVSLDCGHHEGQNSDWFIVAGTPFGWFSLTGIGWLHGLSVGYQSELANVGSVELFNVSGFPSGHYVFYFGIDMKMNGIPDSEAFYFDSVEVNVSP